MAHNHPLLVLDLETSWILSITNGELLGSVSTPARPAVAAPTVTFVELREPLLTD